MEVKMGGHTDKDADPASQFLIKVAEEFWPDSEMSITYRGVSKGTAHRKPIMIEGKTLGGIKVIVQPDNNSTARNYELALTGVLPDDFESQMREALKRIERKDGKAIILPAEKSNPQLTTIYQPKSASGNSSSNENTVKDKVLAVFNEKVPNPKRPDCTGCWSAKEMAEHLRVALYLTRQALKSLRDAGVLKAHKTEQDVFVINGQTSLNDTIMEEQNQETGTELPSKAKKCKSKDIPNNFLVLDMKKRTAIIKKLFKENPGGKNVREIINHVVSLGYSLAGETSIYSTLKKLKDKRIIETTGNRGYYIYNLVERGNSSATEETPIPEIKTEHKNTVPATPDKPVVAQDTMTPSFVEILEFVKLLDPKKAVAAINVFLIRHPGFLAEFEELTS